MRRIAVLLVLAGVAGALVWWLFFKSDTLEAAKEEVKQKVQDLAAGTAKPDDIAALAVKAIDLTQGEHGLELWRLKAEWGSMRREGGILELEKPRFTYYMPPRNEEVRVSSDLGDVNQDTKIIRFRRNVLVHYGNNTIKGGLMVYNGTVKELRFPNGAEFDGPTLSGDAPLVYWRLDEHQINAAGGVDMTWSGKTHLPERDAAAKQGQAAPAAPVKKAPPKAVPKTPSKAAPKTPAKR